MEIKKMNIGLIGAGFMAKAHSIALRGNAHVFSGRRRPFRSKK